MISTFWGSHAKPAWIGEYPRISCRYSELKNTAPIITTDTSAATELPATTDRSLSIRPGRRGWLLRFSTTTNAIRSAAERARAISTFMEAKPCPVASVTPYARARTPPVRLTAPGMSRLTFAPRRGASAGSTGDSRTAARPNGTFMKSVKRHLNSWVRRPPRINPADAPPAAMALHIQAHDYAPGFLESRCQKRQCRGRDQGAGKALDHASGDQHSAGLTESAKHRCPDEEDQTRQEHTSPADDVSQPTT